MELVNARLVAEGLGFPEGPIALPDGSIICVEIRRGTLSRISADGSISVVASLGGGPNGAAIGPDGAVYVCNNGGFEWQDAMGFAIPGNQPADYSGGRIERVDLSTGAVDVLYTSCGDHPLRGPNDLVFDADGGMWFTDHGKQRPRDQDRGGIYYARPDGSEITEVVQPSDFPNGIGLSPDGRTLYWAETHTGRVFRRRVLGPGSLEPPNPLEPGLLAGLPGFRLLDSLAVDSAGYVCVGVLGPHSGIVVIPPDGDGEQWDYLPPAPEWWDPLVTNICFGGPDLRTAYLTYSSSGRIVACDWPRPGLALAY
jgi:gluconolactonase